MFKTSICELLLSVRGIRNQMASAIIVLGLNLAILEAISVLHSAITATKIPKQGIP